jgi:hypothetical protein
MQRIGVRDLRQQASRYLKRVQAGEAPLTSEPQDFGIDASAELTAMRALEDG